MSEPAPASTEPVPVRIQTLLPDPSGEGDLARDTHPPAKRTGGWGLAIEAALSQDSYPLQISSRSVSIWAEVAGQRQDARLWRLLARACEERGEYQNALTYATEAMRVKPNDVASLSLLAHLYEKEHTEEDAAHWHRQVLVHDPTRKTSNRFLAHHYYSNGEYEKALPYFIQLLEVEPQSRLTKLYYLLTRVKTSGIRGVAKLLTEVHYWQHLSPEELALAHELFFLVGKRCLKNKQIVRATQYLTRAGELLPTPEVEALLANAVAQGPKTTEIAKTSVQMSEPVVLAEQRIALHRNLEPRTVLRPIMVTVGVVALTVVLSLPLFLDQPRDFMAQQAERFVPSDDRVPQRLSDSMRVMRDSVPTDRRRDLSPLIEEKKHARTPASLLPKPEPNPKPKPVISKQPQRFGEKREKKATVSVPLGTMNDAAAAANSTAPRNSQAKEQKAILSLPAAAPQPSQMEEPLDQFLMASIPQREGEALKSPLPANDVSPESVDSLLPVEQAAAAAPPPVEQEEQGKTEEVIRNPSLPKAVEGTKSVITTFASQLPYATQSTIREREFPLSPEQLWPRLKALVEQETEVLLREDKEQGVLYGTIVQRQLGPRIHTFKPYGHYIVEVTPGAAVGTSLVRAKLLTFDWRPNKRPVPGAESLADRFLQKIGVVAK